MLADTSQEQPRYWLEFRLTIKDRLRKPCKHPTFVMYFIGIIVFLGGFGIIVPLISGLLGTLNADALPQALVKAGYTYFVAIAATAAVDIILSYRQRKFLLMFFLLCSFVVFLCAILAALMSTGFLAVGPAVVGYILALMLWWIGNADNANLLDTPIEPTNAMGADTKANPPGNLAGFKS